MDNIKRQNNVSSSCPIYGGQLSLLIITPIIHALISLSSILGILLSTLLLLIIIISYLEGC